jgi:L-rhamnose-H+ transport protein
MTPNPAVGIVLHAIGGFAAGSFYSPLKKVRNISWESAWLMMGVAAWLAAPWIAAWWTTPQLGEVLGQALSTQYRAMGWAALFGFLWGFGNLTYGLAARFLGIALGGSIALGFCMVFGTLLPPIHERTAYRLLYTASGQTILAGVALCVFGIALCGLAGRRREIELATGADLVAAADFNFRSGFVVAMVAGVLSACFAFGLAAGKPIADISTAHGTNPLYANNVVLIAVLAGGFASNALSCLVMNIRNRSLGDYVRFHAMYVPNLLLVWLAGVTWFLQFFFYGMGQTKLGRQFEFSSWSIHMAFIVVFLNLWGLVFHEWRGTSSQTKSLVWLGILVLIGSTAVMGLGNYLATLPATATSTAV